MLSKALFYRNVILTLKQVTIGAPVLQLACNLLFEYAYMTLSTETNVF